MPYTTLEIWYICTCTCFLLIDSIDGAACALNFFYIVWCQIKTLPLRNSSHISLINFFSSFSLVSSKWNIQNWWEFFSPSVIFFSFLRIILSRLTIRKLYIYELFHWISLCYLQQGDMKPFSGLFKADETDSLQSANTKSDSFTVEMERISELSSKNVSPNSRITVSSICSVLNSHHFFSVCPSQLPSILM